MTDHTNTPGPETGVKRPNDEPGDASTPLAGSGEASTPRAGDRATPGTPAPAANQGKNEPVPAAPTRPTETSTMGSADPQAADRSAGGASGGSAGDAKGVPVPAGGRAAPGTSEDAPAVDVNPTGVGRSEEDATDRVAVDTSPGTAPGQGTKGGSPTQAAQDKRPLAEGKAAGTNPASQAVVGRSSAPDGEVSPQ